MDRCCTSDGIICSMWECMDFKYDTSTSDKIEVSFKDDTSTSDKLVNILGRFKDFKTL